MRKQRSHFSLSTNLHNDCIDASPEVVVYVRNSRPVMYCSDTEFVGFNISGCAALGVTSITGKCSFGCGGYTYKFASKFMLSSARNIILYNVAQYIYNIMTILLWTL